jgi:hypothetical protein
MPDTQTPGGSAAEDRPPASPGPLPARAPGAALRLARTLYGTPPPGQAAQAAADRLGDARHLLRRSLAAQGLAPDPVTADEETDPRFTDPYLGGPRA